MSILCVRKAVQSLATLALICASKVTRFTSLLQIRDASHRQGAVHHSSQHSGRGCGHRHSEVSHGPLRGGGWQERPSWQQGACQADEGCAWDRRKAVLWVRTKGEGQQKNWSKKGMHGRVLSCPANLFLHVARAVTEFTILDGLHVRRARLHDDADLANCPCLSHFLFGGFSSLRPLAPFVF